MLLILKDKLTVHQWKSDETNAMRQTGIATGQRMRVRDVVHRKDLPDAVGSFTATVDSHDVSFVRLTQQQ
jgi:hypothetical protein